jgi:hypothetical protein
MINKSDQFDFLRELVEAIPDPQEKAPAARRKAATGEGATPRRRTAAAKIEDAKKEEVPAPGSLPAIGTWKREAVGAGGSGEGGKGTFDDYEDDNYDDY